MFAQANDNFNSAIVLSGASGATNAANGTASKEIGEPAHAGDTGGHSIWYNWTAPSSTKVTFETVGSSFDMLLAVYTGAVVSTLSGVRSNNDIFGENHWSRVRLTPTAGVTYRIAVDGNHGATGNVYLRWVQRQNLPDVTVWGPSLNPTVSIGSFSTSNCAVVEGLLWLARETWCALLLSREMGEQPICILVIHPQIPCLSGVYVMGTTI